MLMSLFIIKDFGLSGTFFPYIAKKKNYFESHPLEMITLYILLKTFTGGLKGSYWAAERFADDIMIRRLIEGTFYEHITSDVIVKRRLNEIIITFFLTGRGSEGTTAKVYFLKAFTEKLLSEMMGCIVRMELRTGPEFV